jgi:chaperonin cofactor prefoldin
MATHDSVQEQLQRLQNARQEAEKLAREKSRITGELGGLQKQLQDLEAKCKTDFDCKIAELPALIQQLKTEAEGALNNAEVILGMREGTFQNTHPV